MASISMEIQQAATTMHATVVQIPPSEARKIREKLSLRFAGGRTAKPLWEYLRDAVSIQEPDGWRWVGDYVKDTKVLLLFNEQWDSGTFEGFEFEDGTQLVSVLEETSAFEFYVTDRILSYVLCHNHHDFLIASGSAAEWLRKRIDHNAQTEPIA